MGEQRLVTEKVKVVKYNSGKLYGTVKTKKGRYVNFYLTDYFGKRDQIDTGVPVKVTYDEAAPHEYWSVHVITA